MFCDGTGRPQSRIDIFERQFTQDRARILRGDTPVLIQAECIQCSIRGAKADWACTGSPKSSGHQPERAQR